MSVASPPVQKLLAPPAAWPPTLVVVIDTEKEFDWTAPFQPAYTAVTNIGFRPLAQSIFDSHGLVATCVIDYPVARTPVAEAVLRAVAAEGRSEIGAHLHPWVNPPAERLVDVRHSYPGIGAATPAILREPDYTVDFSVVPQTDFSADGGPDFRGVPAGPFMNDDGLANCQSQCIS